MAKKPNATARKLVRGRLPDPIRGDPHADRAVDDVHPESIEQYLDRGYSYARTGNPTVMALENKIAGFEGGVGATCFSTGMAATIDRHVRVR